MGERFGDVYREWMDMEGLYGVDDVGRLLFSFMSFISFISYPGYMLLCGSYAIGRLVCGTSYTTRPHILSLLPSMNR